MQASLDLLITFVVQLFILVDPVAGAPVFLAITPHDSASERRTMALRGCFVAAVVVWFFILAGPWVLGYFGIKTAAVRTCGGILLFAIALEMLYGRTSGTETSPGEERLAEIKKDISITPPGHSPAGRSRHHRHRPDLRRPRLRPPRLSGSAARHGGGIRRLLRHPEQSRTADPHAGQAGHHRGDPHHGPGAGFSGRAVRPGRARYGAGQGMMFG